MNRKTSITLVSTLALIAGTNALLAGPVNPPAGAVGPSMKTLAEVEPRIAINAANTPGDADSVFKITQAGSYYLTGNVTGVAGKHGIEVAASNVTVDLNGFNLIGVASSQEGVNAYPASRVTVRNGTVSSWGNMGVHVGAGGVVSDLVVDHCGSIGIGTTLSCRVLRCSAVANAVSGIEVSQYSSVVDCLATSNTGAGIKTDGAATVSRCVTNDNTGSGIVLEDGSTVEGCTSTDNTSDGIQGVDNCTVTGNTCFGNGDDGIQVGTLCVVQRNSCSSNGPGASGAGVYVYGFGSTIEDNTLIGNYFGILANTANGVNLIVKNRARVNTANYNISAGNHFASPYSDPNSAGVTPLSNFAY